MTFITVDQGVETRQADDELRSYLEQRLAQRGREEYYRKSYSYEEAIRQLANWDTAAEGPYLARVTLYVYVAAEMLGADFELVGTYESRATDKTTYHSYFVVNRADLAPPADRPLGPDDVLELLRRQTTPAQFLFHSKFSTSSYLLPSLYFRKNRVFSMDESTEGLTAIDSLQIDGGSTDLVKRVAQATGGVPVIAAVWDGTKTKFDRGGEHEAIGRQVNFIQLSTELPNDVLVCSASLGGERRAELLEILRELAAEPGEPIESGDFKRWIDINAAPRAQEAMAALRWQARETPAPVTVEIGATSGLTPDAGQDWYREAAIQAVRLSGTEFVLFDQSFHYQIDFKWTLEAVRQGNVVLRSSVPDFDLDEQTLYISYRPGEHQREDLTQRIGELIRSRLHRIRYLWPYERSHPLIIRDVPFSLPRDATVEVQEITWYNHLRNQYTVGDTHTVRIKGSDPFEFTILGEDADQLKQARNAFDPMSNFSHRALLVRPQEPQKWFRIFHAAFYLLTFGSLVGAVIASRGPRAARRPRALPG